MSAANSTACSSSSYTWLDGTLVNTFYWNVTGGPSCIGTPNPLGPFICGYGKRNSGPSNWFATDCTTTMNVLCERCKSLLIISLFNSPILTGRYSCWKERFCMSLAPISNTDISRRKTSSLGYLWKFIFN
jgi:hypothetical protein